MEQLKPVALSALISAHTLRDGGLRLMVMGDLEVTRVTRGPGVLMIALDPAPAVAEIERLEVAT